MHFIIVLTVYTLTPHSAYRKLLSAEIFEASLTNSVDQDQTAPISGSTLFASTVMLNTKQYRHFRM